MHSAQLVAFFAHHSVNLHDNGIIMLELIRRKGNIKGYKTFAVCCEQNRFPRQRDFSRRYIIYV